MGNRVEKASVNDDYEETTTVVITKKHSKSFQNLQNKIKDFQLKSSNSTPKISFDQSSFCRSVSETRLNIDFEELNCKIKKKLSVAFDNDSKKKF